MPDVLTPIPIQDNRHFLVQLAGVLHSNGWVLPQVVSYLGTFTAEGKPAIKVWMENGDAWEITAEQIPYSRWEVKGA